MNTKPTKIETIETSNAVTIVTMEQSQTNPIQRAAAAAEQLAAEGQPVTARTVRERASVMTSIAAQAAKAWNEAQLANTQAPDIPPAVATRLEAI